MNEHKVIPLPFNMGVPFVPHTQKYGNAEWIICAQWERRRFSFDKDAWRRGVSKIFIYPHQQPDKTGICYEVTVEDGGLSFSIDSWAHYKIQTPNIWQIDWCSDHKCVRLHVYSPRETDSFLVSGGTDVTVRFEGEIKPNRSWLQDQESDAVVGSL